MEENARGPLRLCAMFTGGCQMNSRTNPARGVWRG